MSQYSSFCCMYNHKRRAEYHFDLQPTPNKGYWRNFRVFPALLVFSACLPTTFVGEKLCTILRIQKSFEIQRTRFFGPDQFENNCWVVEKGACVPKTFV